MMTMMMMVMMVIMMLTICGFDDGDDGDNDVDYMWIGQPISKLQVKRSNMEHHINLLL